MQAGVFYAAGAYILWGLFPLYFKALRGIAPLEILTHRIAWALLFLAVVLVARRQWDWIAKVAREPKILAWFMASSTLLSVNWFIYIWSVNNGHVIDSSLGYFMNPLVNVLLGFLLLHERLRPVQWFSIAVAASGVAWLTWQTGHLPWIGLSLAFSFGVYGLLRKTAALGALEGLSLETALLFPLAFGYLVFLAWQGENGFLQASASTQWLLAAAGPITAIPLLMFAAGARRIRMATLGLLQYIAPTIQLLLGVLLYHEPFSGARLSGFVVIWSALAIYSLEGLWRAWGARATY
ncbi:MAG: EamA family transporter RarD [Burkholderiaceae bacterium]|nr:EamA family transporter RarD [Burkholderiaceae bacterium]